jgi:hypothetical protein
MMFMIAVWSSLPVSRPKLREAQVGPRCIACMRSCPCPLSTKLRPRVRPSPQKILKSRHGEEALRL